MITKCGFWAIAGSVLAGFLVLFAMPAAVAHGDTLYEQLNASTLGETNDAHTGNGIPTQKLGTGLSGVFGSMAYKINGSTIASDIGVTQGYGGFVLYSCFADSYRVPCSKVAESSSPPQILSQSGNDAYILATTTSEYTFVSSSYYFLQWSTPGNMALYGAASTTNPYVNGLAEWLTGSVFDADAKISDIAFRICSGATCDLVPPDTTPPELSIDSGPLSDAYVTTASITFTFTATDAHLSTVTCSYDSQTASSCTSPYATTTLADGAHTLVIVAQDSASLSTSVSRSFIKDTVAPALAEVAAITASTDTTPAYSFTSDDAGALAFSGSCSAATSSVGVGTTALTFAELAVGTYSNCVLSVTDAAGNTGTLAVTPFTIEAVPPPPEPAPPARSSGGGGVIGGPLSVGYQTPYLPPPLPPAPPAPTPPPAPEPVTPAPATAQPETPADIQTAPPAAPVQNQTSDVQTPAAPVAATTPSDKPVREQIPMGAAIATSGLQMPSYAAMAAALLLLTLGAAMALRHSKIA